MKLPSDCNLYILVYVFIFDSYILCPNLTYRAKEILIYDVFKKS